MELKVKDNGKAAVVQVTGKLVATTLNESLRGAVRNLFARKIKRVVIDLGQVVYIDSTGVGELVSAYTSATNEKATLQLAQVPESCKELLEITNLMDIFEIASPTDPELKALYKELAGSN
ncbi:MAG TPA: STAS domain-containing protein [Fibrobacteraceae bacterium]|nr:STAS domain-containing protein [Fibrobacteraceae bacterium]